jgi:hypothetical protein
MANNIQDNRFWKAIRVTNKDYHSQLNFGAPAYANGWLIPTTMMFHYFELCPRASADYEPEGRIFLKRLVKHVYEAGTLVITIDLRDTSLHAPGITLALVHFMIDICKTSLDCPGDHRITIILKPVPAQRHEVQHIPTINLPEPLSAVKQYLSQWKYKRPNAPAVEDMAVRIPSDTGNSMMPLGERLVLTTDA